MSGWRDARKARSSIDFSGQATSTGHRPPVADTDAATRKFVVDLIADVTDEVPDAVVPNLSLIFENGLK